MRYKDLYHSFKVWWRLEVVKLLHSEEISLRDGLLYDAAVKGFDSSFWKGDTANLLADTVRGAVKIGDTALVGSASSYSQYVLGDFEFAMLFDSLSPDSNDSEKYFGLRNLGDTLNRGAAFFDLSYDTTNDTGVTRPLRAVVYGTNGTRVRKNITFDTNWTGGGRLTRFRIIWEPTGYSFLINDTKYADIGGGTDTDDNELLINTEIPQALRVSNRSADTTDTSPTAFKYINIRNSRKVI